MQNRPDKKPFRRIRWSSLVGVGLLLLIFGAANAQSNRLGKKLEFTTKQAADRLLAKTRPGYYKAMLLPDWRAKNVNREQAAAVATQLCTFARSQTNSVRNELRLSGNRLDATHVQLTWDMRSDATNDGFSIERSSNPDTNFETVASIKSVGTSAQKVMHQTIDPNSNVDYTYYRVKALDQAGRYTYSPVVAVKGDRPALAVRAFPNPSVLKNVRFQVTGLEITEAVSVSLFDIQGRVLYQNEQAVPNAERQLTLPSSLDIPPGNYFLKIIARNQQANTLFIVQP